MHRMSHVDSEEDDDLDMDVMQISVTADDDLGGDFMFVPRECDSRIASIGKSCKIAEALCALHSTHQLYYISARVSHGVDGGNLDDAEEDDAPEAIAPSSNPFASRKNSHDDI